MYNAPAVVDRRVKSERVCTVWPLDVSASLRKKLFFSPHDDKTPEITQTPHPGLTPACTPPPLKKPNIMSVSSQFKRILCSCLTGATGREEEDPAEGSSEVKKKKKKKKKRVKKCVFINIEPVPQPPKLRNPAAAVSRQSFTTCASLCSGPLNGSVHERARSQPQSYLSPHRGTLSIVKEPSSRVKPPRLD